MKQLMMRNLKNAQVKIQNASDSELDNPNFESNLIKSNRIELPYLDKKNFTKKIGNELVTINNAPEKFPIGPNADYVIISVSVKGSLKVFKSRAGYLVDGRKTLLYNDILSYKEFSSQPIKNNDKIIEQINNNAKKTFGNFELAINKAQTELEEYHALLEQTIKKEITKVKKHRRDKKDTEDKINPFK